MPRLRSCAISSGWAERAADAAVAADAVVAEEEAVRRMRIGYALSRVRMGRPRRVAAHSAVDGGEEMRRSMRFRPKSAPITTNAWLRSMPCTRLPPEPM